MKHIFSVIFALLLFSGIVNAQSVERSYEALEYLQTNDELIYQGIHIPVLDISYHEFSSDSITWRKDYQSGDCYVRFANTTSNTTNPYTAKQGYHDTWWGLNICNLGGETGGGIDTMFVYYYQSDTIFQIDTVVLDGTNLDLKIPSPETLTGATTNYSDTSYHTHAVNLYMGDIRNVDTTGVQNGQVLKWNSVSEEWVIANDLIAGGALGQLSVQDVDGTPLVNNVTNIKVEDGHVVDNGAGSVTISFALEPVNGEQDFYRTDTVPVVAGDTFLTFSSPLSANDYVVVNAYALFPNGERQNLTYDSTAVDGFRVLDIIGESEVHYLVVRDLDSLFLAIADQGKVGASVTDPELNYLDAKTDDTTITVINDRLHVIPDFDTLHMKTTYVPTGNETTGTSYWDADENTYSDVLMDGVIGQRYRELLINAKNSTGGVITNFTPVAFGGIVGASGKIELALAIADGSIPVEYILGVATQDIDDNSFGEVVSFGRARGGNTTGIPYGETWLQGDVIYVSPFTAGFLTNVKPEPPMLAIRIGVVSLVSASNGEILVNPYFTHLIQDAQNVDGTPLTKNGQILVYNNDSMYFDFDYNIADSTATVAFDSLYADHISTDTLTASTVITTGEIKVGYIHHVLIGFNDSTVTQTLTNQNEWYTITNATQNLWTPVDADGISVTNDTISITNTGTYTGVLSVTFSGISGRDFQFRLYDATQMMEESFHIGGTATGTTNYNNVCLPIYTENLAGDEYVIQMRCTSAAGATPILRSASIWVSYIHE